MMIGMLGLVWLVMLLVIGLPVLIVLFLSGKAPSLLRNQADNTPGTTQQTQLSTNLITPTPTHYCAHCCAGLQSDWTHCPQCGAPVQ